MKKYKTILVDPPWEQSMRGKDKRRPNGAIKLPYPTMSWQEISNMHVGDIAEDGCHLWLWTTNQFLHAGFHVMNAWGFRYLAPITWVKPSGVGNYFIGVTQTLLFGYKDKCIFPLERYKPTAVITSIPKRHSQKPDVFYDLIESISPEPRIELFSRSRRFNWDCWGNEVESDIEL